MVAVDDRWVVAAERSVLKNGRAVVRVEDRQIALVESEGRIYAVDNRCPHMGYPLSVGSLKGTTLTCDWHNWKFDLDSGGCLRGEEAVRSYETRVEGGHILVNIRPEPVEELMAKHLTSLRQGLVKFESGRIARDAARLMSLGMRPAEVMREGAIHDAEREEYGWGHALAVIADCLSYGQWYDGADEFAIPVVRALTAASEPVRRYPKRPTPAPEAPDHRGEQEFRRRIEEEDVDGAEAWFRGAIEDGAISDRELSRWLLNAATDHFLGFGHQMIYVFKATQLANAIGWDALRPVLPSIVPSITWATRYDRLPEMRRYIKQVHEIETTLPALSEKQRAPRLIWDSARFRAAVLFGRNDDAFQAVHGALTSGVHADLIARELVLAASERLLRMDLDWETSHDEKVWDEGGWLEITHLLTHANANRQLLRGGVTPEALRSLYHSAWFVNYQKRFDRTDGSRADAGPLPEPRGDTPEEVEGEFRAAVQGKRFNEAMGAVRAWNRAEWPEDGLIRAMAREAMETDDGVFIQMAHVVKTTHAAIQEHRALESHPEASLPLMAAARYLASPRKQTAVYDLAMNGMKFVTSGAARSV